MIKITKILRVEDTRQWEEIEDDKWVPIAGTGIENKCGRCGRSHEVHATVEVDDNGVAGQMIVGTGCMHADEAEVAGKIRSILNAQRTLEKNKRLLAKKEALATKREQIWAEVQALAVPKTEIQEEEVVRSCGIHKGEKMIMKYLCCGDSVNTLLSENMPPPDHADHARYMEERRGCAIYGWRAKRCEERGLTSDMACAWQYVKDLKKRIERSEKKIAEFGLQESGHATSI